MNPTVRGIIGTPAKEEKTRMDDICKFCLLSDGHTGPHEVQRAIIETPTEFPNDSPRKAMRRRQMTQGGLEQ